MAKNGFTFQIQRKDGFLLNPDDKVVNGVIKGLNRNNGKCPCYHGDEIADEDLMCPCKEYRENGNCRCNLYITPAPENVVSINIYNEVVNNLEGAKILIKNLQNELNEAHTEIERLRVSTKTERLVY